jgi:Family of unknown function (DUF6011)
MYIKLDEAFVMAAVRLSPLAEVVIRDRDEDFKTDKEFAAFYPLLRAELADLVAKINELVEHNLVVDLDDVSQARNVVNLIRVFAYKKEAGVLVQNATASVNQALGHSQASAVSTPLAATPAVPFHVGREPKDDPNGSQACFIRNCGKKFQTFNDVMAHKVLAHGYSSGKYTKGWAENIVQCLPAGLTVPLGTPAAPSLPDPDPNLIVQTNLWTPKLNLDLRNLDLQHGEASRFAAGEQHDARFYFIRLLNRQMTIKGKFVWTKYGHRFNSHYAEAGDHVVRKLAGDTKEWVGTQAPKGVRNPAYSWKSVGEPPMHFENVYVGEHEDDILEILNDPHKARRNYGLWRQECGYCGRNLTDAESRLRGWGPDCHENKYLPSLGRTFKP